MEFPISNLQYPISNIKNDGFSLIEILVVTTIMALLMGASIAGYSTFNQKQKLTSSGLTLKNVLRDAQSRAFTGETSCPTPIPLIGWNVDLANRSIYATCGYAIPSPQPTIKFVLQPNITIAASPTPILFKSFPKVVDANGIICLKSSEISNTYYKIIVEESGNINDIGITPAPCP